MVSDSSTLHVSYKEHLSFLKSVRPDLSFLQSTFPMFDKFLYAFAAIEKSFPVKRCRELQAFSKSQLTLDLTTPALHHAVRFAVFWQPHSTREWATLAKSDQLNVRASFTFLYPIFGVITTYMSHLLFGLWWVGSCGFMVLMVRVSVLLNLRHHMLNMRFVALLKSIGEVSSAHQVKRMRGFGHKQNVCRHLWHVRWRHSQGNRRRRYVKSGHR